MEENESNSADFEIKFGACAVRTSVAIIVSRQPAP